MTEKDLREVEVPTLTLNPENTPSLGGLQPPFSKKRERQRDL